MDASEMAAYWLDGHFAIFGQVNIFNKAPLGETGCLGYPCFWLIGCLGIQLLYSTTLFPTQSARQSLVTYPSLCSTCVTYTKPYHSIGHQVLPTQHYAGKETISLGATSILRNCFCSHTKFTSHWTGYLW